MELVIKIQNGPAWLQVDTDGQASGDDKILNVLRDVADHLRAGDGASLKSDIGRVELAEPEDRQMSARVDAPILGRSRHRGEHQSRDHEE